MSSPYPLPPLGTAAFLNERSDTVGAVGRPRRFDPDAVVDGAMRTFWERGYRDTSVERLVEVTGVNPGSLYNAFEGGKRGLFMESLQRYSDLVVPEKLGALEAPEASLAEVRAYFDGLVEDLLTPGRAGGLPDGQLDGRAGRRRQRGLAGRAGPHGAAGAQHRPAHCATRRSPTRRPRPRCWWPPRWG